MVGAEDLVAGAASEEAPVEAEGGREAPALVALTEVRDLVAHRQGGRDLEARHPGDTAIRTTVMGRGAWVAVPSC